jgi:hypothetical protein
MRRLLVNDALGQLGEVTFWHLLKEWFGCEFVGAQYERLAQAANIHALANEPQGWPDASLIIRNASYFGPIKASERIPTISLLQDIFPEGPQKDMQEQVMGGSAMTVINSEFTASKYAKIFHDWNKPTERSGTRVIPLPVDFSLFEPQNAMGCQQALGLPDGCVCWVGASQGPAGHVKGFDIFLKTVRTNPDLYFVAVFKDAIPESVPPNLRCFLRLSHEELVKVIGACRVGLCTSRMESQHLAGIEMGACGLPMIAPPVGVYHGHHDTSFHGLLVVVDNFAVAIRSMLGRIHDPEEIRAFWKKDFDRPVIRAQWEKLVKEIECSGRS